MKTFKSAGSTAGRVLPFSLQLEEEKNGRHVVRAAFESEVEARELYQCLLRHAKGLPSGVTADLANGAAKSSDKDHPEAFNARALRRIVKEDIPLGDFLECCSVDLSKLLAFVGQADADQAEKYRITQKILRFQARARLEAIEK